MRLLAPRRAATAAVAAAALGGLSFAAAPTAHAATPGVLDPSSGSSTEISFDDDPSVGTCTLVPSTPAPGAGDITMLADGVPHGVTVTASATDTLDASDVDTANVVASRSITATQAGGQLSHVTIQDSFSATMTASKGAAQTCNLSASVDSEGEFAFDLVRPTYVTVTGLTHGMVGIAAIANDPTVLGSPTPTTDDTVTGVFLGGNHATGTAHVLLPAGTFYMGVNLAEGGAQSPTSASGDSIVQISFDTPGLATANAAGSGSKYVTLPAATDCSTHAAVATWTHKAGKKKHSTVKKATFKVGSAKVGADKKPVKGDNTKLTKLPGDAPYTITGTIKLASGKTVTVSRDYQACS